MQFRQSKGIINISTFKIDTYYQTALFYIVSLLVPKIVIFHKYFMGEIFKKQP